MLKTFCKKFLISLYCFCRLKNFTILRSKHALGVALQSLYCSKEVKSQRCISTASGGRASSGTDAGLLTVASEGSIKFDSYAVHMNVLFTVVIG